MQLSHSSQFQLVEDNQIYCYEDLQVIADKNVPFASSESALFIKGSSVKSILIGIIAALKHKCSIYLIRDFSNLPQEAKSMNADWLLRHNISEQEHKGVIWLQTSGTSGHPKWLAHNPNELLAAIAPGSKRVTWMLSFQPASFAGLQVILSAVLGGHKLVCPNPNSTPSEFVQLVSKHNITHMSGTPTFWRSFLRASFNSNFVLEQITLGGEVADQATLNTLSERFSSASIRHIYATTELGVVFTVKDGKAGFPTSWFGENLTNRVKLSLSDNNTLLITGPRASLNHKDKVWDTQDVVSVEGERAYFKGRADSLINVGGSKVFPEEVESHLLQLPCISDVVVTAQPNPITGYILIADVVPNKQVDEFEIRKQINDHLQALPRYARPALLRFKDQFSFSATGKKSRQL